MQKFKTGATRNDARKKLDYEGFLSPIVLERFAEHMQLHAIQEDGKSRPSDNWQKGIPQSAYMKSLIRHTIALWKAHRGYKINHIENGRKVDKEDLACAIMFNAMGYLFEELRKNQKYVEKTGNLKIQKRRSHL